MTSSEESFRIPNRWAPALLLALAIPLPLTAGDVILNEIHYAPGDKTVPEEFVELYNRGTSPVDLSGWFFSSGISYVIPQDVVLEAGSYLVVAENPEVLMQVTGATDVLGPFEGRLSNDGERVVLRNAEGAIEDEVVYSDRFPWPLASDREGASMELMHPELDNRLGGNWRASGLTGTIPQERVYLLRREDPAWHYRKGTSEASDPPSAWRYPDFIEDDSWQVGQTSIGFGDDDDRTILDDMLGNYSTVYLRRTISIASEEDIPTALRLVYYVDDGLVLWINGAEVARVRAPEGEIPFDGRALNTTEARWREIAVPNATSYLRAGENVVAIHALNQRASSADFSIDIELFAPGIEDLAGVEDLVGRPTPGRRNSVFSEGAPPALLVVSHSPAEPAPGENVLFRVSARDLDGFSSVRLEYQLVDPGQYIRLTDSEYETSWTVMDMQSMGPDPETGGVLFLAALPGEVQLHRRLVRYRVVAADGNGDAVRVPYIDDPQPNFAYFVYGGVPAWKGASRPGLTPVWEFSEEVMRSLPVYHLIAREQDVLNCQYNASFENRHFLGTMVYEGIVYDHIEFEVRGEFSTYVSGKNKWRFFFHRGHEFQARDSYGRKYRTAWRKMNVSGVATPWVPTNRGMAGLDEGVAFKLYALAGVPSPNVNHFHFRIIDEAVEAHPTDQYRGDLWGLYMTIEHTDGRFLDERGLPDGNTYKIEAGNGDKRNQGPTHPTNTLDYIELKSGYSRAQPIEWWRAHVDLEGYFSFRSVNRAINNHDLREGWNICQYHNPVTDRWTVIPWDLDMLYMPVTHWSGVMDFQNSINQHQQLRMEYRNRGRELRDLLFTPDQFSQLVDEFAAFVNPPGEELTFVDVDEAMWNFHPRTAGNHRGAYYRNPSTHGARGGTITRTLVSADLEGMAQWAKDFVLVGYGANFLRGETRDVGIPDTPEVTALGDPSFPIDDLVFRSSAFSDPQGEETFGAMKWRIAEVTPAGGGDPRIPRRYEIDAAWESEEFFSFQETVAIPAHVVRVGATYRVRTRMMDDTGRWSHWSEAVEFATSPPTELLPQQTSLRVTELMYHPQEDVDLEFIELQNIGPHRIDLSHVALTEGIEFRFNEGRIRGLDPGEFAVVVNNQAVFATMYDASDILIAGEYVGRLSDRGERIALRWGAGVTVLEFTYDDQWYPETDGGGYSLVIHNAAAAPSRWSERGGWRPSSAAGGSPGREDLPPGPGGLQLPGDLGQDGRLDVTDAVRLLRHLFGSAIRPPPCEGTSVGEGGNRVLTDVDGSLRVNISDAVHLLRYLFLEGPPPAFGMECLRIVGCPDACRR